MKLRARAARGLRAALEPLPTPREDGALPKLTYRSAGLDSDEALQERAEAALALHDEETVAYIVLAVRSDKHTLDVHAQVPKILSTTMLDGMAAMYAGMLHQ